MSENWIDVKIKKPDTDQLCYVFDSNWSMNALIAIYHKDYDVFVAYDPGRYTHPSLSVTHWVPLPSPFLTR